MTMQAGRSDADALKLERDGQLYYGLPNERRIMVARCIKNGHDGEWVEYGRGGVMRCVKCLTFFREKSTKLSVLPHDPKEK